MHDSVGPGGSARWVRTPSDTGGRGQALIQNQPHPARCSTTRCPEKGQSSRQCPLPKASRDSVVEGSPPSSRGFATGSGELGVVGNPPQAAPLPVAGSRREPTMDRPSHRQFWSALPVGPAEWVWRCLAVASGNGHPFGLSRIRSCSERGMFGGFR